MLIIEKEFNALTGLEKITEREETPAEAKARKAAETLALKLQAEQTKRANDKTALLERLGITAEEAALLLG